MKNSILTGLFIMISIVSFCQTRQLTDYEINQSGATKLVFATTINEAEEFAQQDIENGTPFLLLMSGIAPTVYTTDSVFENKYDVFYYENGCTGPDYELMTAYNSIILDHLLRNYGRKWKKTIRKDVIGYKKWKRKN